METVQLDFSSILREEGSSIKHSFASASLHMSNDINNPQIESQAEGDNQVKDSQMETVQLDFSGILREEGSSIKHSFASASLHMSDDINNPLIKSHAEDENQVKDSQVLKASEEYHAPKDQLLSSGSSIKEPTPESSLSDLSDGNDNEEEADIDHIGDKYQAEVPTLFSNIDQYLCADQNQNLAGLPIPVIWVQHKERNAEKGRTIWIDHDKAKRPAASRKKKRSQFGDKRRVSVVNLDRRKDLKLAKPEVKEEDKAPMDKMNTSKTHILVPDIQYKPWNDADANNILLALYIFGKNFVQVKRFIENKSMEDILHFYYAKFCKSNRHRRWSDCIKRRKEHAWGMKLFSGERQQEMLSRLLSCVKEENRNKLLEVSTLFTENGISLEEYVFSLKDIVGLHNLYNAIGIGRRGKEDLTGPALKPVCSKIPTKKVASDPPREVRKVVSKPHRLEDEQTINDGLKEVMDCPLVKLRKDNVPDHQDHGCLIPQHNIRKQMFTIVDTSSIHEGKAYRKRKWSEALAYTETNSILPYQKKEKKRNSVDSSLDAYGINKSGEKLNCEKNVHSARKRKDTSDCNVLTNTEFTVVDTSSVAGEKTSSFRGIKFVSKGLSLEPISKLNTAASYKKSVVEQWQEGYNVPSYGNMHVEDINGEGISGSGALNVYNETTNMGGSMVNNSTMSNEKQSKRKLRLKRRAAWEHSNTLPLKSQSSTSFTLKEIQDNENVLERLESKQLEPYCKQYSPNAFTSQDKEPSTSSCAEALKTDTTVKHKSQNTRNRPLTIKAHEALESSEIYNVWKRKIRAETENNEEMFSDNTCRASNSATKARISS